MRVRASALAAAALAGLLVGCKGSGALTAPPEEYAAFRQSRLAPSFEERLAASSNLPRALPERRLLRARHPLRSAGGAALLQVEEGERARAARLPAAPAERAAQRRGAASARRRLGPERRGCGARRGGVGDRGPAREGGPPARRRRGGGGGLGPPLRRPRGLVGTARRGARGPARPLEPRAAGARLWRRPPQRRRAAGAGDPGAPLRQGRGAAVHAPGGWCARGAANHTGDRHHPGRRREAEARRAGRAGSLRAARGDAFGEVDRSGRRGGADGRGVARRRAGPRGVRAEGRDGAGLQATGRRARHPPPRVRRARRDRARRRRRRGRHGDRHARARRRASDAGRAERRAAECRAAEPQAAGWIIPRPRASVRSRPCSSRLRAVGARAVSAAASAGAGCPDAGRRRSSARALARRRCRAGRGAARCRVGARAVPRARGRAVEANRAGGSGPLHVALRPSGRAGRGARPPARARVRRDGEGEGARFEVPDELGYAPGETVEVRAVPARGSPVAAVVLGLLGGNAAIFGGAGAVAFAATPPTTRCTTAAPAPAPWCSRARARPSWPGPWCSACGAVGPGSAWSSFRPRAEDPAACYGFGVGKRPGPTIPADSVPPGRAEGGVARLVVVQGDGTGKTLVLTRARATVGRHATNDLVLADPRVSSTHLELERRTEGRVLVRDLAAPTAPGSGRTGRRGRARPGRAAPHRRQRRSASSVDDRAEPERDERRRALRRPARRLARDARALRDARARRAHASSPSSSRARPAPARRSSRAPSTRARPRRGRPFVVLDCGRACPARSPRRSSSATSAAPSPAPTRAHAASSSAPTAARSSSTRSASCPSSSSRSSSACSRRASVTRVGGHEADPGRRPRRRRDAPRPARRGRRRSRFREDLYFRLAAGPRRRPAAARARRRTSRSWRASFLDASWRRRAPAARSTPRRSTSLAARRWPGNVRELRNVLARAAALCQDGVIAGRRRRRGLRLPRQRRRADALDLAGTFAEAKDARDRALRARLPGRAGPPLRGQPLQGSRQADIARNHLRDLLKKRGLYDAGEYPSSACPCPCP